MLEVKTVNSEKTVAESDVRTVHCLFYLLLFSTVHHFLLSYLSSYCILHELSSEGLEWSYSGLCTDDGLRRRTSHTRLLHRDIYVCFNLNFIF
jgi:hypothetical protein